MKRIVLTGGGTAGHVTPNIAMMPRLKELGYEILYIGSRGGIEKNLIEAQGIPYYGISTGKLRRYFDLKNFTDPIRVQAGYHQARKLMKELKPNVVFSKGGFVAVPVVAAAAACHIPVITHESDMTPGLANRLTLRFATKICCNYRETARSLPESNAVITGTPIRSSLLTGDPEAGLAFTGLPAGKPVLMIIGGSQGAASVNQNMRRILPRLLPDFSVIHLCGKGKLDPSLSDTPGYVQYEYIQDELPDLFALADLVVSRAGANAICEILALAKPNLLIPLPQTQSRGDQILNARSFERQGFSRVLEEAQITPELLLDEIHKLYEDRQGYIQAMKASSQLDSTNVIVSLIEAVQK